MKEFTIEMLPEWEYLSSYELGNKVEAYIKEWFGVDDVYEDLEKEQFDQLLDFYYENEENESLGGIPFHVITIYEDILCEQGYQEDE